MKNYLVTGGLGFIGSHIVEELMQIPNSRVWIIDDGDNASWNPRKGRLDADEYIRDLLVVLMGGYEVNSDNRNPSLVCISGDCTHPNVLTRISAGHFSAVFHCAANVSVTKSIDEPLVTLEQNTTKTLKIARACAKGQTKLIFSSSAAVYGDIVSNDPIKEDTLLAPTNPYGLSKMTCENWFKTYRHLYDLNYTVLRYFNVFGPRQRGGSPYAGVIGNWVHNLYFDKPLTIYGDGNQTRDFVYVKDVAHANIMAMKTKNQENVYNVCSQNNISLNDIIKLLQTSVDTPFEVRHKEQRQEVRNSIGSNNKINNELGWQPSLTFEEGILETLEWRGL